MSNEVLLFFVKITLTLVLWKSVALMLRGLKPLTTNSLDDITVRSTLTRLYSKSGGAYCSASEWFIFSIGLFIGLVLLAMIPLAGPLPFNGKLAPFEFLQVDQPLFFCSMAFVIVLLCLGSLGSSLGLGQKSESYFLAFPLLSLLLFLIMGYLFGTYDFHEIVQYQQTTIFYEVKRYGFIEWPIFFLFYMGLGLSLDENFNYEKLIGRKGVSYLENTMFVLLKKTVWACYLLIGVFVYLGGYGPVLSLDKILPSNQYMNVVVQLLMCFIKYLLLEGFFSLLQKSFSKRYRQVKTYELLYIVSPVIIIYLLLIVIKRYTNF